MNQISVLLLTLAAVAAAGGQLMFKIGARGREHWAEFLNISLLIGIILYGFGTLIWIYTLSKESLVNVYAFTALSFVLVYLGGVMLLGERLAAGGMIGILFVLAGLYLITHYG